MSNPQMVKGTPMDRVIAYCGLVCSDCPYYIATQANDQAVLEQMAAERRERLNAPEITVESITCDGCTAGGRLSGYCAVCEIYTCGAARGVPNCAHCADYACERLEGFLGKVPKAREVLDQIKITL